MSKSSNSNPTTSKLLDSLGDVPPSPEGLGTKQMMKIGIIQACISGGISRFNLAGRVLRKKDLSKSVLQDAIDFCDILDELLPGESQ